jgi:hypothetical protein
MGAIARRYTVADHSGLDPAAKIKDREQVAIGKVGPGGALRRAIVLRSSRRDRQGGVSSFLVRFHQSNHTGGIQMKTLLLSGAVIAFTVTSAFAQTVVSTEYYVVRDASTKKCTIVDKRPTTTTTTVVDNGVFKTKTEAETGMKTMKVCTEN